MYSQKQLDFLTYEIIGAAIEVHKSLGPGLLESVYHRCMKHELMLRNISFTSEQKVECNYKGLLLDTELRCDMYVANCIAVEFKAVDAMHPVHDSIVLTYMRLLTAPKGILINFNCTNIFKEGQKTFVNHLYQALSKE
jgi:GxxExxY protein